MNKVQLLNNAVCFGSFPPREMPQRRSSRQISKETENGEDHAPRQSSKREAQQWICLMNSEIWSCIGWFGYLITFYRPGCRYTRCTLSVKSGKVHLKHRWWNSKNLNPKGNSELCFYQLQYSIYVDQCLKNMTSPFLKKYLYIKYANHRVLTQTDSLNKEPFVICLEKSNPYFTSYKLLRTISI